MFFCWKLRRFLWWRWQFHMKIYQEVSRFRIQMLLIYLWFLLHQKSCLFQLPTPKIAMHLYKNKNTNKKRKNIDNPCRIGSEKGNCDLAGYADGCSNKEGFFPSEHLVKSIELGTHDDWCGIGKHRYQCNCIGYLVVISVGHGENVGKVEGEDCAEEIGVHSNAHVADPEKVEFGHFEPIQMWWLFFLKGD